MSEKIKAMVGEMEKEEVSISHFIHEHPLTLIKSDVGKDCYGCGRFFMGEAAYGCKKCGNKNILHEECGEMPREIRHPKHPQHTLLQKTGNGSLICAACEDILWRIGYFCSSSGCEFQLHLRCTPSVGLENVSDKQTCIEHPSHPQHQLILSRKRLTFKCDACGANEAGRSYMCITCQYWIHERCAALPTVLDHRCHHHPLSLAFDLPPQYSKFFYKCDVCGKELLLNRWIYHCQICRYIVHLKCAIKPSSLPNVSGDNANKVEGEDVIQFPLNDFHEELIKPFVLRRGGEMFVGGMDKKYKFSEHSHQLSLVSLSISEVNDDEDDFASGKISKVIICDGCTMPIAHHDSSSYYMSCDECKYFLHLACFFSPPKLYSHPLHNKTDHTLILKASEKLSVGRICNICYFSLNGLFYSCTKCHFIIDIKCTCLPNTIKHGAHPQHHLHSKFWQQDEYINGVWLGYCSGCHLITYWGLLYKCGSCDYSLCSDCVLLPALNQHEADKHPLPLKYDAHLDHPGDFYCDSCERQMNPKAWMYHCSYCITFFQPCCFPTTVGKFRNFKFGFQCNVPSDLHTHPLTFGLLTTKLRCDVCGLRVHGEADVDQCGFHCPSCNFFMCYSRCGKWRLALISPIDS